MNGSLGFLESIESDPIDFLRIEASHFIIVKHLGRYSVISKKNQVHIEKIVKGHFNIDLLAIYIFGSSITEYETKASDIDIAIICNSRIAKMKLWDITQEIAIALKKEIDLLDLTSASTVMQMQVVTNGKRIYCVDKIFSEKFEDFVFFSYTLLNEERKGILEDIKSRGNIYG